MKRYIKNIAAILLAASVCACSEYDELENNGGYIPAPGETIKLVLNADKGEADVTPETRVFVGNTNGGKVTYYWNDGDQIGVIPMNISNSNPNYVTEEVQIYSDNQNQAQFASYITGDEYKNATPHLLIYYPYNKSMLEGASGNTGEVFAKNGLRFRLPQYQEQYGYNRAYIGSDPEDKDVNEHPSVWAVSNYGLAYDLASCFIDKTIGDGHTDVTATGDFKLDHANTYFQFNVFGKETTNIAEGKNYADGSWKVASVTVEAGYCQIGTDDNGETAYTLTDKLALAGTYKFTYNYQSSHFATASNGSSATDKYGNNENIKLTPEDNATVTSVKVNMNNIADAPVLKNNAKQGVPVFAVINALDIKNNPKGNLNCLKVAVMCYQYDANGNIISSDTRTRYYNIESIVGKDISGNFYSIDFEVCDPVESYSDLSVTGTANCYLISAPGNYSFNANIAGNGKLPWDKNNLGIDPTNLLQDGKTYAIDWLWASGQSFDAVKSANSSFSDAQIVESILEDVQLTGKTGQISVKFADDNSAQALSGNIVLALYETDANGAVGDIVWTWHLWLGNPKTHHYKFPATHSTFQYTNEDWYMMDRNLGAETDELNNPRSTGLFYQRSRKEPLIGWGSTTGSDVWTANQLPTFRNEAVFGNRAKWTANKPYDGNYNTLKYPMALITGYEPYLDTSEYYYGWSSAKSDQNDTSNDTKSMFDPCPVGYRMPTVREWDNLKADIYFYSLGVQGTGVFGYCQWLELESVVRSLTDERVVEYLAHIAGGDYYTFNDAYEREYHIKHFSGNGKEIITRFPNTALLRGSGNWVYHREGSYTTDKVQITHPAGPELTANIEKNSVTTIAAPQISTDNFSFSNNATTVKFSSAGTYYYSIGSDNSSTTKTITTDNSGNITVSASGSEGTVSGTTLQLGSINSGGSKTIYFYNKNGNQVSGATTLMVSKSSSWWRATKTNGSSSTSTTTVSTLVVDFSNDGNYSYATSANGPKTTISGKTFSVNCSNSVTYYFYSTDSDGIISNATQVTVTRRGTNGSYTYACQAKTPTPASTENIGGTVVSNSETTMALWTSGRINDDNSFNTFWFGVGPCPDGWSKKTNGVWGTTGGGTSPFNTDSRKTYGFTYSPVQLGIYTKDNAEAKLDPAIPTRCIREYDNNSTVAVAE